MHPIEGSYVDDGHFIYAVKGLCVYGNYLVVTPKYNVKGCVSLDNMFASEYMCPKRVHIDNIGRRVCVIPRNEVVRYYDPYVYSSYRIPSIVNNFIELIKSSVYNDRVGLSGSYLLGCSSNSSDIDLVITTLDPQATYEDLLHLRKEGFMIYCNKEKTIGNYRDKIESERNMSLESYLLLARYKVLEGCYRGVRYSIRILNPFDTEWCKKKFYFIDRTELVAEIVPITSYTTPALYEVYADNGSIHYYMVTWRLRFSELPRRRYIVEGGVYIDENGTKWIVPDMEGSINLL